jgi:drug/metabolite transporter (DMT)-like permease
LPASASHLRSIGFALFAFTVWVLCDTLIKLASEAHIPSDEIVAFLGLYSIGLLALKAAIQGNMKQLWPKKLRLQLSRGVIDFVTTLLVAISLKHLPLPIFYIVVFSAPLITAIAAALFLKEHLKAGKIIAIIAGFGGVIIAINPAHGANGGDWVGYAAGFASTICLAANMIWLRVMTQSETVESVAFSAALIYCLLGFTGTLFHPAPVDGKLLLILFAMGLTGVAGNLTFYQAFKHTSAANVAQMHYTQIITGSILAWFIWHDRPTLNLVIGAAVIIASGIYMASEAHKSDKAAIIR